MSDPKLHYPKAVIIDADTFAIIASLIVFEFKENPSRYEAAGLGLRSFIFDVERYSWDVTPETVTDMGYYLNSSSFANCLANVRDTLMSLGDHFPENYSTLLRLNMRRRRRDKYPVAHVLTAIDRLLEVIKDHEPMRGFHFVPRPPV